MSQKASPSGLEMLRETVRRLEEFGPETPTVVDLKRLLTERVARQKNPEAANKKLEPAGSEGSAS